MYDLQIYNFWTLKVVDSKTQNSPDLQPAVYDLSLQSFSLNSVYPPQPIQPPNPHKLLKHYLSPQSKSSVLALSPSPQSKSFLTQS